LSTSSSTGKLRNISAAEITAAVEKMAAGAAYQLGERELKALKKGLSLEKSSEGRGVLEDLLRNAKVAAEGEFPLCQDTGLSIFFVEWGQDLHLTGDSLENAINQGVRLARKNAYLRASVVADPFSRQNTGDNTPAIIHTKLVPGNQVKIMLDLKGGGSENMSRLTMLKPADGINGVVDFAVSTVQEASGNACPPVVVGLAVGGNFEEVALMAKRALLRPLGDANPDTELAEIEERVLTEINRTGVGPAGLGGMVTALAVHMEVAPCHLASLPVAVNIDCHSHRHARVTL
jgi:fumarate hydratase subunit alpha